MAIVLTVASVQRYCYGKHPVTRLDVCRSDTPGAQQPLCWRRITVITQTAIADKSPGQPPGVGPVFRGAPNLTRSKLERRIRRC